jgi:hypothetical protein
MEIRQDALDPKILTTLFKIQANWHVIKGAPCCGKMTLIELLVDQRYPTVPEVARAFMDGEICSVRAIEQAYRVRRYDKIDIIRISSNYSPYE